MARRSGSGTSLSSVAARSHSSRSPTTAEHSASTAAASEASSGNPLPSAERDGLGAGGDRGRERAAVLGDAPRPEHAHQGADGTASAQVPLEIGEQLVGRLAGTQEPESRRDHLGEKDRVGRGAVRPDQLPVALEHRLSPRLAAGDHAGARHHVDAPGPFLVDERAQPLRFLDRAPHVGELAGDHVRGQGVEQQVDGEVGRDGADLPRRRP